MPLVIDLWLANAAPTDPDAFKKVIDASVALLKALVGIFGPWGTLGIVLGSVLLWFSYLVYQNYRKDKELNLTIKALNEQIQRLADQDRSNRLIILTGLNGYTMEEAERLIIGGGKDPKETREILGRSSKRNNGKKQSSASKKDSKKKE